MRATDKYLSRYAEPETDLFAQSFTGAMSYQKLIVIPVYDEPCFFLDQTLGALNSKDSALVILVLNIPQRCVQHNQELAAQNTVNLLKRLLQELPTSWQMPDQSISLLRFSEKIDLLVIDRCTSGREIPNRQGVGLARKIGCDIGYWLITNGHICSDWIHSTDADAQLPTDYLDTPLDPSHSAILFPYQHQCDQPETKLAMDLYELSLHYYVTGLGWAGSPYAFHSLGSIIAINARYYAQVRGFPKRSAAEDFYLLNKLVKLAPICQLDQPTITLAGRLSARVPFGTGPALNGIMTYSDPRSQFLYYNPLTFQLLKSWIGIFQNFWRARDQLNESSIEPFIQEQLRLHIKNKALLPIAKAAISDLNPSPAVHNALRHSRTEASFLRHLHTWFDGLRTLKLIHALRDHGLRSGSFHDMVEQADFVTGEKQNLSGWQDRRIAALMSAIGEQATPKQPVLTNAHRKHPTVYTRDESQ